MKTEDQIKALAELDGWVFEYGFNVHKTGPYNTTGYSDDHGSVLRLKDYLTSYDAIIPLIQSRWEGSLEGGGWLEWQTRFYKSLPNYPTILKATPDQLCEALLRATGKWKD